MGHLCGEARDSYPGIQAKNAFFDPSPVAAVITGYRVVADLLVFIIGRKPGAAGGGPRRQISVFGAAGKFPLAGSIDTPWHVLIPPQLLLPAGLPFDIAVNFGDEQGGFSIK